MKPRITPIIASSAMALLLTGALSVRAIAREWDVAKSGNEAATGTAAAPFLTIGRAARDAQPGDTVVIHAGVYREQVALPRGGTSDDARITFVAAPGEKVIVAGSDPLTGWQPESGSAWQHPTPGVWRADVPDAKFGAFNPFATLISGPGYLGDSWRHLGEVYLNGAPFAEQPVPEAVAAAPFRWYAMDDGAVTHIWVNFGPTDPSRQLVEINTRPSAFAPAPGLNYITIDGLTILQTANNWASPDGPQPGAISTRGGTHWIIRNCTIADAKCVGVSLEQPSRDLTRDGPLRPSFGEFDNIAAVGHHVVSNNLIQRCGQAGIFGVVQGTDSQIIGNQIEGINSAGQFSGDDVGGIRLADAVDTISRGNLIRRIRGGGILLGPLYQGVRITDNVIMDVDGSPLTIFHGHGPVLVDYNVIAGPGAATGEGVTLRGAEANVFANNLFADCAFTSEPLPPFLTGGTISYRPHSLVIRQTIPSLPLDNKWFANLFIRGGLGKLPQHQGDESDFNGYMAGASASPWGDAHSAAVPGDGGFALASTPSAALLMLHWNALPRTNVPVINFAFIGRFALTQGIEQPDGEPIRLPTEITSIGPFPFSSGGETILFDRKP